MYICIILICWQLYWFLISSWWQQKQAVSLAYWYLNFFYMVIFTSSRKKEGFCNVFFSFASKRIINLGPVHIGRDSPEPQHQPVGIRIICGHCSNTFLVRHTHGWQRIYYLYIILCQLLLIILPSLSCSGLSFLTEPWPDVHTAEKCKYWNNSWLFPKTVLFLLIIYSLFSYFQLFYWSPVPQEEEPAVFPAVHHPRRLHSRTYGECLCVWRFMVI